MNFLGNIVINRMLHTRAHAGTHTRLHTSVRNKNNKNEMIKTKSTYRFFCCLANDNVNISYPTTGSGPNNVTLEDTSEFKNYMDQITIV